MKNGCSEQNIERIKNYIKITNSYSGAIWKDHREKRINLIRNDFNRNQKFKNNTKELEISFNYYI